MRSLRPCLGICLAISTLAAPGCLDRKLVAVNPCLVSAVREKVDVQRVEKVDLLLMVDNSNSMAGEQESLRRELPNVIRVLTTGQRFEGDPHAFPPVKDLHVGVVSSDMGVPGVDLDKSCRSDGGDDGRLQHTPRGADCQPEYPPFLTFVSEAASGQAQAIEASRFAEDVACIATLGTGGCGFEQQLEAPLKALMPRALFDNTGTLIPKQFRFLATEEPRTWGRGDLALAENGNKGFLRDAKTEGLSVLAIMVLTDEDDCSVTSTQHLLPNHLLPADSPYRQQDINLRCFYHKEFMQDLRARYYDGFRSLRPGHEDLVVFAAIVGVPTDLVDERVLPGVDFSKPAERDGFYASILSDPRMVEQPDPSTEIGTGRGNLIPSCNRKVAGEAALSTAYPPRRIVELAQMFRENGVVQSICQDDFGPAMSAVINIIAAKLGDVCLPKPLVRQANGFVPCDVVWELPATAPPGTTTPTACEQSTFLSPVDADMLATNRSGGVNCKVAQIPVTNLHSQAAPEGPGWFYDNFTEDLQKACTRLPKQRIAFTVDARPPSGVTVKLLCLNETQRLDNVRMDLSPAAPQPSIGSSCAGEVGLEKPAGDDACLLTLRDGTVDKSLFCHPSLNVCVQRCTSDTDCPPAWVCDDRPDTLLQVAPNGGYCVNPTCGAESNPEP